MDWRRICDLDEITEDKFLIKSVKSVSIGIISVNGAPKAYLNICPHAGAPICKGKLTSLVVSNGIYDTKIEPLKRVIKCPWHAYEFDIETGEAILESCGRLVNIKSKVELGKICLWV